MSVSTHPLPRHGFSERLLACLSAAFTALVWLGETGPRAQAVRKLNGESDESLAAVAPAARPRSTAYLRVRSVYIGKFRRFARHGNRPLAALCKAAQTPPKGSDGPLVESRDETIFPDRGGLTAGCLQ